MKLRSGNVLTVLVFTIVRDRLLPAFACAAAVLGTLGANACRPVRPAPAISIEHEITPVSPVVGTAEVHLRLTDEAGRPVTNAQITLEANMSHPGMTPVFAAAKETGDGLYTAPLQFTMAGDWVILLHCVLPEGEKVERQFEVTRVRAN